MATGWNSFTVGATESGLGTLGTVLGTSLFAIVYAGAVQSTAHRVVTNTRKVLNTTATDQNHRVFLQVVAFTTDVG
jgi:hypothetical protein